MILLLLIGDCGLKYMMSNATTTKESTSQDVEMKDVEKTDTGEEVKKDPDILTLEGMLSLKLCCFHFHVIAEVDKLQNRQIR